MAGTPPRRTAQSSARRPRRSPAPPTGERRGGRRRIQRRLLGVLVVQLLLFGAVVFKLVDLQVMRPDDYRELSHSQRVREQVLAADRGTIFDRSGHELAVSAPYESVFVDPALIEDPTRDAVVLADAVGVDAGTVEHLMRQANRFGYVARHVDEEVADAVRSLGIPGVGLVEEPLRIRPNGTLAHSILGLTDIDALGISGLEEQYGDVLTGTPGRLVLEQAPDGRTIAAGEHHLVPAVRGTDLVLSIDRSLQYETERALVEQVEASDARGGVALVARPDTGEILAMANVTRRESTGEVLIDVNNAALTTAYEPGSVMKVVAVAAAVEDGHVDPDTVLTVPDVLTVGGWDFTEHTPHGTVAWPVRQIIAQSSNTGTILLARSVGRQRFYDYLRAFGFGERTALDFPNEQQGGLRPLDEWWDSSMGSIPMGQGISVTPLQMLMAYNVVAAGGVYAPPRLVLETIDPDGTRRVAPVPPAHQVLSEHTAAQVNLMLREVVEEGTGQLAAIDGYSVAGKTGTARKPQPNGGYTDEYGMVRYQATFVGFVPAEAPALSILVMIDEPGAGVIYGGALAAPVFATVAEAALRRFDIARPATDQAAIGLAADSPPPDDGSASTEQGRQRPATTTLPVGSDGRVRALPAGDELPVTGEDVESSSSDAGGATWDAAADITWDG
ncbi:MAG: penicillin-binding protein 2 [Acidimicrobiia bacterium]|nr:penicillin-binding protein 2 [Acidimicrobiia bacterium]